MTRKRSALVLTVLVLAGLVIAVLFRIRTADLPYEDSFNKGKAD